MPPPIPRPCADQHPLDDSGSTSSAASSPTPPSEPGSPTSTIRVHTAAPADQARLSQWLQTLDPLPAVARRGRDEALARLLERPELGLCLLAGEGEVWSACLPVHLLPRLDLAGLAVLAAQWCSDTEPQRQRLLIAACRDWLADWCRAHGVRHLLLAPALAPAEGEADFAGARRLPDGLWHLDLAPAAKLLG